MLSFIVSRSDGFLAQPERQYEMPAIFCRLPFQSCRNGQIGFEIAALRSGGGAKHRPERERLTKKNAVAAFLAATAFFLVKSFLSMQIRNIGSAFILHLKHACLTIARCNN